MSIIAVMPPSQVVGQRELSVDSGLEANTLFAFLFYSDHRVFDFDYE